MGDTIRPSAAHDVAAPLTRALTLFMHELFTAMITVVNSTASVTIFKICEKRTTNHLSAGFSTTPRTLATGATNATTANANDARLSAFVTPKVFSTSGNMKSWNAISATPPTMSTMPICDALKRNPPRSSRVLAYTGKISSYPMAMNAKTAYEEAAATVCASHPFSRKPASACAESPDSESRSRAIRTTTASVVTGPRSRRVSSSASSASMSSASASAATSRRATVSVAFAAAPRPAGASATTACETPLSSSRTSSTSGPTVFFSPKLSGSAAVRSKASPSKSPSAAASTSF
mmetsp:Transcript_10249/g.43567  ORF Transcript_10249/g.43567 Transcript_10249/m.43567 type:complete len:292 (-) Transcript_10249:831-1706(-)